MSGRLEGKIAIVVGGGNLLRGRDHEGDRSQAELDHVGMLATVMNALALAAGEMQKGFERVRDAVSESEWIEEGTDIRVVSSEGYRLVVRPLRAAESEASEN